MNILSVETRKPIQPLISITMEFSPEELQLITLGVGRVTGTDCNRIGLDLDMNKRSEVYKSLYRECDKWGLKH
jgi:hypothetical protein